MKTKLSLLLITLCTLHTYAQDIIIDFSGNILGAETAVTLDGVQIENITQNVSIIIAGNSNLNLTTGEVGIAPLQNKSHAFKVYPNPFSTFTTVDFHVSDKQDVHVTAVNLTGQVVAEWRGQLTAGNHSFRFIPKNSGVYLISVNSGKATTTAKAISFVAGNSITELTYLQTKSTDVSKNMQKSTSSKDFPFTIGDYLQYTGFYQDYATVMVDSPEVSSSYILDLVECTDYDGNNYKVVKLGEQWWMGKNLKSTHYADGTQIEEIYWHNNNYSAYAAIYGAFYIQGVVLNGSEGSESNPSGVQGVCPTGWHLPSDAEWKELEMFLGMSQEDANLEGLVIRGTNEGSKLAGNSDLWTDGVWGEYPLEDNIAFGSSGFNALPGGVMNECGEWEGGAEGVEAYFYTATRGESMFGYLFRRILDSETPTIIREAWHYEKCGSNVRCVRDNYMPHHPSPAHTDYTVSLSSDLSWSCGNPDGLTLLFDVYIGTSQSPELVASDITEMSYEVANLQYHHTYWWKIVTKHQGTTTEGPVWWFSTMPYQYWDQFEDNDQQYAAAELEEYIYWENLYVIAGDDDWYALEISADSLVINCDFIHSNGDINIDLVDENGTVIATSQSITDSESINHVLSSSTGIYYLHVYLIEGVFNSYGIFWDDIGTW